jgi:hypothetical protein
VTVGEVGISLERRPKRLNEPSPLVIEPLASLSSTPGVTVMNGDGDVGGVGFEERRSRVPESEDEVGCQYVETFSLRYITPRMPLKTEVRLVLGVGDAWDWRAVSLSLAVWTVGTA